MRDNNWVENQLIAIGQRLDEELDANPGDENKGLRHRIHVEKYVIDKALAEFSDCVPKIDIEEPVEA